MDTFFHVMGVACLAAIAGIAAKIFVEAAGEHAKIAAAIAPLMPSTVNVYRARVDSGRRKVAALIALVLVCAASLYRGGFGA